MFSGQPPISFTSFRPAVLRPPADCGRWRPRPCGVIPGNIFLKRPSQILFAGPLGMAVGGVEDQRVRKIILAKYPMGVYNADRKRGGANGRKKRMLLP